MAHKNREDLYARQRVQKQLKFDLFVQYLQTHPCVDCGETDIIVLQFDHLPEFEKKFEIAKAITSSGRAWTSIILEIAKCEVVCANDHSRRTAKRLNSQKYQLGSMKARG